MSNILRSYGNTQLIAQDFDDAYARVIVIERDDMNEAKRQRVALKYRDENGDEIWLTKTLVINASGEVISIIVNDPSEEKPSWIGSGIIV